MLIMYMLSALFGYLTFYGRSDNDRHATDFFFFYVYRQILVLKQLHCFSSVSLRKRGGGATAHLYQSVQVRHLAAAGAFGRPHRRHVDGPHRAFPCKYIQFKQTVFAPSRVVR